MTWRKGNIVFIFGAVFPAAIHFCSFKVRLRTCTLLSLPAIPLLPPVTTHLTRGLPFDMQIDALCSKQTLGANIFHTALSAVTIEDGAALLAPSTTWLTLRKNTPTNAAISALIQHNSELCFCSRSSRILSILVPSCYSSRIKAAVLELRFMPTIVEMFDVWIRRELVSCEIWSGHISIC